MMYSKLRTAGLLMVTLILSMYGVSAIAQPNITVGNESVQQGGTVFVDVDFENDGSVVGMNFDISYDPAAFPSVDVATDCNGNDMSPGGVTCTNPAPGTITIVVATFPLNPIASTTIGSIGFTADAAAPFATYPLTIENVSMSDDAAGAVAPDQLNDGSVAVVDATSILNVQPANINFPATENGTSSAPQAITISNDGTDGIDLEVSNVALATGTHFSISANSCAATPFTLSDGESCTYDAVFSPTAIGNFNDTVSVTSDAGAVTNDTVALSGEGTAGPAATLDVAPGSNDFGDVLTGDSATFTFTVSNTGEAGSSLDIDAIGLGGGTDFSISGGTCSVGDTLGDGDSCTVAVDFAPAADGAQSDTLTVDGTDTVNSTSVSDSAALDGNGVSEARFASDPAPGGVNMGLTPPGGSLNQTVMVTNEGNENLTVNNCTLNDPDALFSVTPDPIDFSIAPDASDSFAVSCDVPAPGSFSASLSCDTNDPSNATVTYNFTCNGQILEIPTMQSWGLVLLTMLMLLIGGLSIRYFRI